MLRAVLLLPLVLLLACGGDPAETDMRSGKPKETVFAPSLGVPDLGIQGDEMKEVRKDQLFAQDLVVGTGAVASKSGSVIVYYSGWRSDGLLFNDLQRPQQPLPFSLSGVIQGWRDGLGGVEASASGGAEGIAPMRVGGKRRLIIGADLAYGDAGSPPSIPPRAVLVFDVELLGVQ